MSEVEYSTESSNKELFLVRNVYDSLSTNNPC